MFTFQEQDGEFILVHSSGTPLVDWERARITRQLAMFDELTAALESARGVFHHLEGTTMTFSDAVKVKESLDKITCACVAVQGLPS